MTSIRLFYIFLFSFIPTGCESCQFDQTKQDLDYIYGKVVKIYDGDTYELLTESQESLKVRMEGIDAPERDMPYYRVSRQYLSDLIFKKVVKFHKTSVDIHGRSLGFTYLEDGTDVNLKMLEAGMVWHFKRYNSYKSYAGAEDKAKALSLGLWQEANPTPPWQFRKQH